MSGDLAEIPLTEMEGEPRARDLDIAKRLGFDRPRKIRELIERNITELTTYGPCPAVGRLVQSNPVKEYWLNEEQALLIASVSEAPKAPAVRSMLIKTFVAWRRGHLAPASFDGVVHDLDPAVRSAIGGIVKGIVHRELSIIIPAAVEAAINMDPRRAVLDYVSVRQLLDEAKAFSKRRNGLNRKVGYDLRRRAFLILGSVSGQPSPIRRCPNSGVWLFKREIAEAFMRERGFALVAGHNAAVSGQTVIAFPDIKGAPRDGQS